MSAAIAHLGCDSTCQHCGPTWGGVRLSGSTVATIGRRVSALCDLTATTPADWLVSIDGSVRTIDAEHVTTGQCVCVGVVSGGPAEPEFITTMLDGTRCGPTTKRVAAARADALRFGQRRLEAVLMKDAVRVVRQRTYETRARAEGRTA